MSGPILTRHFLRTALCAILGLAAIAPCAQAQSHRQLKGYISMAGEPPLAYVIYFTNTGGRLAGTSVTANRSSGNLKAAITGTISADGTEMFLKETHSLDGPSSGYTYYCFFTARLKLTIRNGKRIWSGPFSSFSPGNGPCDGGTMTFVDLPAPPPRNATPPRPTPPRPTPPRPATPPVAARPRPPRPATPRPDTARPTPPRPRPDTPRIARADTPSVARVDTPRLARVGTPKPSPPVPAPIPPPDTTGLRPLYRWGSDTVAIELWDGFQEDGDVVSIRFNGRLLLDHRTLSRVTKERLLLPLSRDMVNVLSIDLHEEGREAPNTPRLTLRDGIATRDLDISGNRGQSVRIYFMRQ